LNTVEIYPYIEYIKYLLAGSIALSIFVVAMIGGGITFIDDKARGLHEGYLVTPIKKTELVAGLIGAGTIKGLMAGMVLTVIGGMIAGIPRIWDPVRLFYLAIVVTSAAIAMMSFMFLRPAGAARHIRRSEHAAVLPFRRGLSDSGISTMAPLDCGDRSVYIHGARAAQPHTQGHRH
jgi:ABC-type multidrug transport system permease subunit